MNHLKGFNEAIIEWETDNIKLFYKELKEKGFPLYFEDIKKVGEKYDIEIVDYKTFLDELPTEELKADAPPKGVSIFGLVNPVTDKARIVINSEKIYERSLDYIFHILKHENVHIGQIKRKKDKKFGEYLGDVTNTKEYFSNKDEVMAFAQTVSDMIMDRNPKSIEEAIKMIKKTPIWGNIEKVDDKTKKRYKKYIYLYLEREFKKRTR